MHDKLPMLIYHSYFIFCRRLPAAYCSSPLAETSQLHTRGEQVLLKEKAALEGQAGPSRAVGKYDVCFRGHACIGENQH